MDGCAYLPQCHDADAVSVATLHQFIVQYINPSTLPPVPSVPSALIMYTRLETRVFERLFAQGPVGKPMYARVIEIFYREQWNWRGDKLMLFLEIFNDSKDKALSERQVIDTCRKACVFLNQLDANPKIDYRTVTGHVFLHSIDTLVTRDNIFTALPYDAPPHNQHAYETFVTSFLNSKRRKIA